MQKFALIATAFGAALAMQTSSAFADANNHAYVDARNGNNGNAGVGCPVTAPCADVDTALGVISAGGSIEIIGPGVFGPILLTQAVSIHGTAQPVDVQFQGSNAAPGCVGGLPGSCGTGNGFAIEINAASTDNVKIGYINAHAASGNGALKIDSANVVQLSHSVFRGNSTTTNPIVWITPSGSNGIQVYMAHGDIGFEKNGGAVLVQPTATGGVAMHFNHMEVHNAQFGIKTDASSLPAGANVDTFVSESELFSFKNAAITALSVGAQGASGAARSAYNDVNILHAGGQAINANGANTFVILTNSTLAGNTVGVQTRNGASILSSVNNTIQGNNTDLIPSNALTPTPTE